MVGVMGILCGYLVGTLWPNFMSASNPGPVFMMLVAVVFSFAVAYIAYRGVNGSTAVNIGHQRHPDLGAGRLRRDGSRLSQRTIRRASPGRQFDSTSGEAYTYEFATTTTVVNGVATDTIVRDANQVPQPKLDAAGKPVPFIISYPTRDATGNFLAHENASSRGQPAQVRLGLPAGHGRHPHPGGL